jgi:hypothetical protein
LKWLSEIFKRRRIRCKPSLNENQKVARVAYARQAVESNFSDEARTIFVDEKRFEANSAGVYNLPVEDLTPTKKMQSKSNPVFVMVLVAIAAPRRGWNGVVGYHFFVERVAAAKNSKNREAGTMELHAINAKGDIRRCVDQVADSGNSGNDSGGEIAATNDIKAVDSG